MGRDRQRNEGIVQRHGQGCVGASRGSENLSFHYRPRLVCSSLLHLRASGEVNHATFACAVFCELRQESFKDSPFGEQNE